MLVTGAGGFVGGYVTRELARRDYLPVCLARDPDRVKTKFGDLPAEAIRIVRGDLCDHASIARAADGCTAAIHLVGIIFERPLAGQTFRRIHVDGTAAVLEACAAAGVRRYVHMSALGTRAGAASKYHRTKWEAEQLVRSSGLSWTIFRPSVIHAPDGEFMRMMKFFCTSRLRQPVMPYFGNGESRVQPISVRDVAHCFVRALANDETVGQVYELGGPERYTWKALYDTCALAIRGRKRIKVPVPVPVAKVLARTIMPIRVPPLTWLVPYPFNTSQVVMSQEDSVCDTRPIERTFDLELRSFHEELSQYARQIP